MTAPLFYAAGLDRAIGPGGEVVLDGAEAAHAIRSMRLRPTDDLSIADGEGFIAHGSVGSISGDTLTMTVRAVHTDREPALRLTLVQALSKGGRDLQAIEAATEIGVDHVIPWQAERSIVAWRGDRAAKGLRKWRSALTAAGKQSRRARVPELDAVTSTAGLAAAIENAGKGLVAIVLDADSTDTLAAIAREAGDHDVTDPVGADLGSAEPGIDGAAAIDRRSGGPAPVTIMLIVGPEGGVSEHERDTLVAAGARTARIGRGVLRASTAGPVGLSVVRTAADAWDVR